MRVFCLTLLIVMLIALTPALLILLYGSIKASKRKKLQKEIAATKARLLSEGQWFPVRYASKKRFEKIWKFCTWEATGILFVSPTQVIFFSKPHPRWSEEDTQLQFNIEDIRVKWIGMNFWPNGTASWLAIEARGEEYYFTSETGTFVFGSKATTREIYEGLSKVLSPSKVW